MSIYVEALWAMAGCALYVGLFAAINYALFGVLLAPLLGPRRSSR